MRSTVALSTLVAGLAALSLSAQGPAATFRTDTRLVEVNVVVHDKAGKPVPGLTRADFTLLEDGKAQPIELFSVESDATPAASPAPALAPGDFSNRLDGRTGGAVTVVLFDRLNTPAAEQRQARDQVVKALGQIRREDHVALYVLDSTSLRMLHDFTSDPALLVRLFSQQVGREPLELDASEKDLGGLQGFVLGAAQDMSGFIMEGRVAATTAALEAVADRLAGVRGRKNLIWISSGFPLKIDRHAGTALVENATSRAIRAADAANIAIYPVDARGLAVNLPPPVTTNEGGSTFQMPGGRGTTPADVPDRAPSVPIRTVDFDAFKAFAEDTGGRAFVNTNGIANAVQAALQDGRVTYVLGYYPSHKKWDSTFRAINVKVNRPGVEVRHRKGYLAFPVGGPAAADGISREKELRQDARNPLEATGIGLTVHIARAQAQGEQNVSIAIHLDPGSMVLEKKGEQWTGALDFVITQHTPDGRWIDTAGSLSPALSNARHDQVVKDGVRFTQTLALRDDVDEVHVAVRDPATDATGSLVIPASAIRAALRP